MRSMRVAFAKSLGVFPQPGEHAGERENSTLNTA